MLNEMFAAGEIKPNAWETMIFLNALSHNFFTSIREQLEGLLTSTKDGVDFDRLISHLHYEAQKHHTAATEEVHAILSKKTSGSHPTVMI